MKVIPAAGTVALARENKPAPLPLRGETKCRQRPRKSSLTVDFQKSLSISTKRKFVKLILGLKKIIS